MSKGIMKINKREDGSIRLEFDSLYAIKSVRHKMPPAGKVEQPKKGKGSYSRKQKHKGKYSHYNDSNTSFFMQF